MTSMYDLPSWDRSDLDPEILKNFEIMSVGESFYSLRTTFSVKCLKCGKTIHKRTNNPTWHINIHLSDSPMRNLECQ